MMTTIDADIIFIERLFRVFKIFYFYFLMSLKLSIYEYILTETLDLIIINMLN